MAEDRAAEPAQPAKWKMAIVNSVIIYPLILLLPAALKPIYGEWPFALRTLVNVVIAIALMTWVITPLVTTLLHRWLYPDP